MEEENTPTPQNPDLKPQNKGWLREIINFVLIVVFVVMPIRLFVAKPFLVSGASMYPTFHDGNYLIVDQLTYKFNEPKRGDVIVFKYPEDTSRFFIKRIIALPNEKIILTGNSVTVTTTNDETITLDEPYIELKKDFEGEYKLGADEYFVMGDNRLQSLDSRYWGFLKKDFITGRAFFRLFPFNEIDILPGRANY
jgi:signal peptidase I